MRYRVAACAVAAGILVTACVGNSDSMVEPGESDASSDTPVATSESVGPPEVTFDACSAVSDSLFRQFGLDPTRKARDESDLGGKSMISCSILQRDRSLSVFAQNVPWEDTRIPGVPQPMQINGREALYIPDSITSDSCSLLMRASFGAVIIDTFPRRGGTNGFVGDACDGVVEMAEAIEPLITD